MKTKMFEEKRTELSNLVLIRNHSTIYPTLIKIHHKLNALTLNSIVTFQHFVIC